MPTIIRKWVFRGSVTIGFLLSLLLGIVLMPRLTYARHTVHGAYTIYHQQAFSPQLLQRLDEATYLLETSEFYRRGQQLDICLNDGAAYPRLLRQLRGPAFAWGFADKVVLQGAARFDSNYVALNGYRWNATALLAHEMTHCLQASALGIWHANPIARLPEWKWEGYAEYVSRPHGTRQALQQLVHRIACADSQHSVPWAIPLPDGTIAPLQYARYQALMQYCIDVEHWSYRQLLADTITEATVQHRLQAWAVRQAAE